MYFIFNLYKIDIKHIYIINFFIKMLYVFIYNIKNLIRLIVQLFSSKFVNIVFIFWIDCNYRFFYNIII